MGQAADVRKATGDTVASGELKALDPDLPILAARAAMQLDSIVGAARHGRSIAELRIDAIEKLAEMVTNVSVAMSAGAASKALLDPLAASMMSRAYSEASNKPLRSWSDLEAAAGRLSEMLRSVAVGQDQKQDPIASLGLLRDFCVKLSEYAASKLQLAYGERPVPTHWR